MATIEGLTGKIEELDQRREAAEAELAELEEQRRLYRMEHGPYIKLAGALAEKAQEIARGNQYAVTFQGAPPNRSQKRNAKEHKNEDDKLKAAIKDKRGEFAALRDQEAALIEQRIALDNKRLLARAETVEAEIADLQIEQRTLREAVNGATADLAEVEGRIDGLFAEAERKGNGAAQKAAEDAELQIFNLQMTVRRKKAALSAVEVDLAKALDDKRQIADIRAAERKEKALDAWQKTNAEIIGLIEGGGEVSASKWADLKARYDAAFTGLTMEEKSQLGRPPRPDELYLEYVQGQYQAMGGTPATWSRYGWLYGSTRAIR